MIVRSLKQNNIEKSERWIYLPIQDLSKLAIFCSTVRFESRLVLWGNNMFMVLNAASNFRF